MNEPSATKFKQTKQNKTAENNSPRRARYRPEFLHTCRLRLLSRRLQEDDVYMGRELAFGLHNRRLPSPSDQP